MKTFIASSTHKRPLEGLETVFYWRRLREGSLLEKTSRRSSIQRRIPPNGLLFRRRRSPSEQGSRACSKIPLEDLRSIGVVYKTSALYPREDILKSALHRNHKKNYRHIEDLLLAFPSRSFWKLYIPEKKSLEILYVLSIEYI